MKKCIVLLLFLQYGGVTHSMFTNIGDLPRVCYGIYETRQKRLEEQARIKNEWFTFDKETTIATLTQFIAGNKHAFSSVGELINSVDEDGDTLLHTMQFELHNDDQDERADIVQFMMDNEFDVSKKNSCGRTYAQEEIFYKWFKIDCKEPKVLEEFVDRNARYFSSDRALINQADGEKNKTLLQWLQEVDTREYDRSIAWLKEHAADRSTLGWLGHDMWNRRVERNKALCKWFSFTPETPVDNVKKFIAEHKKWFAKRGDLIHALKDGNTLLHKFIADGMEKDHALYKLLTEDPAFDRSIKNALGYTVEQASVLREWFALAQLGTRSDEVDQFIALHDGDFDAKEVLVNASDDKGNTFLHHLALRGADSSHELFDHLTDVHDAYSAEKNDQGQSAREIIVRRKWFSITQHTKAADLEIFIRNNSLLFEGVHNLVNCVNANGDTLLHRLVRCGCTETHPLYSLLKDKGARTHIRNKVGISVNDLLKGLNYKRMSAQWDALGAEVTVQELKYFVQQAPITHISNIINQKDSSGNTLLHRLASAGVKKSSDIMRYLLDVDHYADTTIANNDGKTYEEVTATVMEPAQHHEAVKKTTFLTGKNVTLALIIAVILYIIQRKLKKPKTNGKLLLPADHIDVAEIIDDLALGKLE